MTKKICVITGSRAEYGLLKWLMWEILKTPDLSLQIIATGSHLSPEFGLTHLEIERDGFHINRKVEMLVSADTSTGIAKSMGLGMIGYSDALMDLSPDLLVLLGDRFEIFSAAAAGLVAQIPIAHIHGGEVTEGSIDESFRHSITKMSHIHFVAAMDYRRRVIQLGESPNKVFLVGGLGVDAISQIQLMDRKAIESDLGIKFGEKNLMVAFHPKTTGQDSFNEFNDLLLALDTLGEETRLIFTMSNADAGNHSINSKMEEFSRRKKNRFVFPSLGQLRYLSCLAQVDGIIGNSSSGLAEMPSFKKGTINIGDRQSGRLQSSSIINCPPKKESIIAAIEHMYSPDFQSSLASTINPYGDGGASKKMTSILRAINLRDALNKSFHNLVKKNLQGFIDEFA